MQGPLLLGAAEEDCAALLLETASDDDDTTDNDDGLGPWLVAGADVPATLLLEKTDVDPAALLLVTSADDDCPTLMLVEAGLLEEVPTLDAVLLAPALDTVCDELPPEPDREDTVVDVPEDDAPCELPTEETPPLEDEPWLVLSTQRPCTQPCPAAQSASCAQEVRQTPPLHT